VRVNKRVWCIIIEIITGLIMSFEWVEADAQVRITKTFLFDKIAVFVWDGRPSLPQISRWCLLLFEQDPNETGHQSGPPGPPGKGIPVYDVNIIQYVLQLLVASGNIF